MRQNFLILILCFLFSAGYQLRAQQVPAPPPCSVLGQTPATAFPVCATDTFVQSTVPVCTNFNVVVPGCPGGASSYQDKNPFWYRFTCYQSGTLGFLIAPNDLGDDYDWQLYDITGVTNLNLVYTMTSLFVVGNWSGSFGLTGASTQGIGVVECGSDPADHENTFSIMPSLKQGHIYLLLVSHFSDSQSGYKLSFGGGTAVITDPTLPDLQSVKPSCDATTITLKLNKKMKCSSLAADGSDFTIFPALATAVSATASNCSSSFDMDSVTVSLSNPLPAGNYSFIIKTGTDANTLLDDCDRDIPQGHQLPFNITPPQPTLPDSILPLSCAPSVLQLVFDKNIQCSSIAADGSDFVITGPAPVTITAAAGFCTDNLSSNITLTLASPVVTGGTYVVKVVKGSDGNTLIDECGQVTPVGASVNFSVKDTVGPGFDYNLLLGCKADTVIFSYGGGHGVNQWLWIFDDAGVSNQQTDTVIFKTFGEKQISLKVSNGFCGDSTTETINLDNSLKASFATDSVICPEDAAVFKNNSTGNNIINYNWDFGDGNNSTSQMPNPEKYPVTGTVKNYLAQLIIENNAHCFDTASSNIQVLKTCYIAVPNAFTPNGDGNDDYLYPLNALKADNLDFNIYNRLGQLVFHSTEWTQKWDGKINGQLQSTGVYVWTLRYINHDTGKKVFQKGTTVLIR